MKKFLPFYIIILACFLSSCGLKESLRPVSGVSTSDSYQPTTKGSTWTYDLQIINGATEQNTMVMTGNTSVFNGKTYYDALATSKSAGTATGYYYTDGKLYSLRQTVPSANTLIEFQYLDISLPVGSKFISKPNDTGFINGVPGQVVTSILEKGITRTLGGKLFTNVIHVTMDLQYDYGIGSGFESTCLYNYYVAKGIGLIEVDTNIFGIDFSRSTIVSYNIR